MIVLNDDSLFRQTPKAKMSVRLVTVIETPACYRWEHHDDDDDYDDDYDDDCDD